MHRDKTTKGLLESVSPDWMARRSYATKQHRPDSFR